MSPSLFHSTVRVLCYGDSLTAGYCGTPMDYCPYATQLAACLGIQVDHVGLSGWRVDEMVANAHNMHCVDVFQQLGRGLEVQLALQRYDVCILMAGTNDLGANRSVGEILANLQSLHRTCHARGVRTVALSVPGSQFFPDGFAPQAMARQQLNAALPAWAASHPDKMLYVDMTSQVPFSPYSGDWAADGLHMSRQGYTKFGMQLAHFVGKFVTTSVVKGRRKAVQEVDLTAPRRHSYVPLSTSADIWVPIWKAPASRVDVTTSEEAEPAPTEQPKPVFSASLRRCDEERSSQAPTLDAPTISHSMAGMSDASHAPPSTPRFPEKVGFVSPAHILLTSPVEAATPRLRVPELEHGDRLLRSPSSLSTGSGDLSSEASTIHSPTTYGELLNDGPTWTSRSPTY